MGVLQYLADRLKKTILKQTSRHFFTSLYAQPYGIHAWANIVTFRRKHPKEDQNLQVTTTPLRRRASSSLLYGSPPTPPSAREGGLN